MAKSFTLKNFLDALHALLAAAAKRHRHRGDSQCPVHDSEHPYPRTSALWIRSVFAARRGPSRRVDRQELYREPPQALALRVSWELRTKPRLLRDA